MAEMFQKASDVRQVIHPAGQAAPFDTGTEAIGPILLISAVVGVSGFSFDFFNEGGTNNLLPGRQPRRRHSHLQGGQGLSSV
jgi:hypothetical protein